MADYDRQNMLLSLAISAALIFLLWAASHGSGLVFALAAVAFSFLGLTGYALIHEASHGSLHTNKTINTQLGILVSWLFPVSFSFMEIAHQVHHRNNRTDGEIFDYYYPGDNMPLKYAQWYSILIGIYPPIIPIGSVLMAFIPAVFRLQAWKTAKSSSILFDKGHFDAPAIARIRREVILGAVFWLLIWHLLGLNLIAVATLYVAFWVNWSTRQYVSHAFSPRDVINGAWNLKVGRLMSWILLNSQWDLVHHQHPKAHWQELPKLGASSKPPIPYWKQYFSLWAGPRPGHEPAPVALGEQI